jgi:DNA-binding response OmpR family regulator
VEKSKILIVEDDADLSRALVMRLKANGFHPTRVSDTVQALRQIRIEPPDLILLDLGLPGGDGFLLMDRLSLLPIDVPVIVLTARDPLDNEERSFQAGASAFFQKPVDNDALLKSIRSLLALSAREMPSVEQMAHEVRPYRLHDEALPQMNRLTFEVMSSLFAGQHN